MRHRHAPCSPAATETTQPQRRFLAALLASLALHLAGLGHPPPRDSLAERSALAPLVIKLRQTPPPQTAPWPNASRPGIDSSENSQHASKRREQTVVQTKNVAGRADKTAAATNHGFAERQHAWLRESLRASAIAAPGDRGHLHLNPPDNGKRNDDGPRVEQLAGNLVRVTLPNGRRYCEQAPPEIVRNGSPFPMQAVPGNCP